MPYSKRDPSGLPCTKLFTGCRAGRLSTVCLLLLVRYCWISGWHWWWSKGMVVRAQILDVSSSNKSESLLWQLPHGAMYETVRYGRFQNSPDTVQLLSSRGGACVSILRVLAGLVTWFDHSIQKRPWVSSEPRPEEGFQLQFLLLWELCHHVKKPRLTGWRMRGHVEENGGAQSAQG